VAHVTSGLAASAQCRRGRDKIGCRCITLTGAVTEFPIATANSQPIGVTEGLHDDVWFTESAGNKIGHMLLADPD
jgi:streptogramin lyase